MAESADRNQSEPFNETESCVHGAVSASWDDTESLLHQIPALIWFLGDHGECTWCNQTWRQFTGRTLEQDRGSGWYECIYPDDRARFREACEAAMQRRGPFQLEVRLLGQEGRTPWMLARGAPRKTREDRFAGFAVAAMELTPRESSPESHAAEMATLTAEIATERKRAERWFQHLLESAPDSIIIVGQDGNVLLVNRQTEILFGYSRQELIGISVEKLIPRRFREAHVAHRREFSEVPHNRPMYTGIDLFGLRKDGREIPVDISLSPIESPQGLVVACAVRDISERVRAEHLLKQRQDELAHVGRLAMAGEMATGLAHELNQPLYSIVNYARGCIHRLDTASLQPDQFREVAREIASEAERAAEIIRRLRRLVQKREPVRSVVDVNQAIQTSFRLFQSEMKRHSVCLEQSLHSPLPKVAADEIQLQQVVLNLLHNAVHAMNETPLPERALRITTREDDLRAIHVTVSDCGCGVPASDLERIFDAFHTTTKSGMGMGLAISRSIIESHGGRIWAENRPGRGASFHFTLPMTTLESHDS